MFLVNTCSIVCDCNFISCNYDGLCHDYDFVLYVKTSSHNRDLWLYPLIATLSLFHFVSWPTVMLINSHNFS